MSFLVFDAIGKRFPGVTALDGVSFAVGRGRCHALLGENGAGKSTLGKILAGVHAADAGAISIDGVPLRARTPLEARRAGVAMVHQELAFCPGLTVAENLCLGDEPTRAGFVDRAAMRARARRLTSEIGIELDADCPVGRLSTGQEQMLQIAAALAVDARIIVMDEPTSSLAAAESERLFALIDRLKARGVTLIYVSHRLDEIFRLCDDVTVLRDGRHVATRPIAEVDRAELVRLMIGRPLSEWTPAHLARDLGPELLRVESLSSPGRFSDISLSLRAGEVVALAGLVGSGRSDVATAICGLDPGATGRVAVDGRVLPPRDVHAALAAGLGLLPEDRKRLGLVLPMSCRANASLAALTPELGLARFGFVRRREEQRVVAGFADRLRVRTPTLATAVAALSGGNQQKIALAKWLVRRCRVLIVDEPTRGVDVGAKLEIHRLLDELAGQGLAILAISSDLPEVLALARRVLVMRAGRLVADVPRAEADQESLMRAMAGVA
ncbi:MAG TPA: sugar ABC transporter ATP-binding protein [Planctomycetota bacterium]|nr:sugar ABC transporter ATP-binding protein [Planctomycetota bacterium]